MNSDVYLCQCIYTATAPPLQNNLEWEASNSTLIWDLFPSQNVTQMFVEGFELRLLPVQEASCAHFASNVSIVTVNTTDSDLSMLRTTTQHYIFEDLDDGTSYVAQIKALTSSNWSQPYQFETTTQIRKELSMHDNNNNYCHLSL